MVEKTENSWAKLPASKIVDSLIEQAIEANASFIHIEPSSESVYVRFRVNGELTDANQIPKKRYVSLIERFKLLANLNVRERHVPQEGRFKAKINDKLITLRISMIPTINGEKIAINIQKDSTDAPSLRSLGLWGGSLQIINSTMNLSKGMVLITGPTDSGKSSTIYSLIGTLDRPGTNIATIEDPVEYRLTNANQTEVNPRTNLTLASGLEAILKHDTNIIMVSELRDPETTRLAFEAGNQGHLVISSLYVDNAATAISRLRNLNIESASIAHVLKLIISQRLVRRLCTDCRESYEPDKITLIKIDELLLSNKKVDMKTLHHLESEFMAEDDLLKETKVNSLSTTGTKIKRLWRPKSGGCKNCNQTGYLGRIGIFEALPISPTIQKLTVGLGSGNVIQDQAIVESMVTIQIDGLVKALVGVTSLEEVIRFGLEDVIT